MYKQIMLGLQFSGFLQSQITLQYVLKSAQKAPHTVTKCIRKRSDPTCYNDLGIVGLHVPVVHPGPLGLPLLLGFLRIERICIVFQDDQLSGERSENHSPIQLGVCVNVCARDRMEEAANILVKRGQCIVFARLM